jgi:tetratricopeptide (TPR) repeat protein
MPHQHPPFSLQGGKKFFHMRLPYVTIWTMLRSKWYLFLLVIFLLGLLGAAIYQIPWVNQRLSWRVDIAQTYLRGMFQPAGPIPTPARRAEGLVKTALPSPAPTQAPPSPTPNSAAQSGEEEASTPVAISASPTPTPRYTATPIPEKVDLQVAGWERQDWNNCGPAALSIYLKYYGWEGDQFSISSVLKPEREDRNVNVEELVHYARNYAGWLVTVFRVGGDLEMLKAFIAAGIPVMIEASFFFDGAYWPNDDLWAAHYLLVSSYDETIETFTVQDTFQGPDQVLGYDTLDEYWKPFNRVFILSYLPHQEETVRQILGDDWEEEANRQGAVDTAQAEIEADPQDAYAWFNLGTNLLYFERYEQAADAYDQARQIGWPQRMLRYQFGPFFAYFHSGRTEDLLALTEYALERTPNSEEALLWRGWGRYRNGDYIGAISDFQAALDANYLYQDAQYALNFVTGQ